MEAEIFKGMFAFTVIFSFPQAFYVKPVSSSRWMFIFFSILLQIDILNMENFTFIAEVRNTVSGELWVKNKGEKLPNRWVNSCSQRITENQMDYNRHRNEVRLVQLINGGRMKLMKVLNSRAALKQLVSKRQKSWQWFWQLESNEVLIKPFIERARKREVG